MCRETGIKHWYKHALKSVETSQEGKVTFLWNQQVQTDKTTTNNKPEILNRDNEKATCMLIDVAIWGDRNVIKKESENILKYKHFTIEIQCTWNVKTNVIPFQNHSENTWATYRENTKSRNYRKQPYWALHTHCGKYWCKSTIDVTLQITLYAPWTVTTE